MPKSTETAQGTQAPVEQPADREASPASKLIGELVEQLNNGELTDAEAYARFAGEITVKRLDDFHGQLVPRV